MQIKSISFKNYKAFYREQTIELKPITILIGKNSSGKSAVAKLFTLLENSLSCKYEEPLRIKNNGVELGSDFRDLVYNNDPKGIIQFTVTFNDGKQLKVGILKENEINPTLRIYNWSFNNYDLTYSDEEKLYEDKHKNKYYIKFNGFIPVECRDSNNTSIDLGLKSIDFEVDYIGPFRIIPERVFTLSGQINYDKTGIRGENAYSMLGVSKLLENELYKHVGEWYKDRFNGWHLKVNDNIKPYFEIKLTKENSDVNIVDVGQGMNQALPIVVRSFVERNNSLIVLEQPELHLHPAAHADLAELFAISTKVRNQKFIIETHSENILLRIRRLIVSNEFGFTHNDVIIYWINDGEIDEITIDKDGVLSDWPDGVFNENIIEITELKKALRNKQNRNDNIN